MAKEKDEKEKSCQRAKPRAMENTGLLGHFHKAERGEKDLAVYAQCDVRIATGHSLLCISHFSHYLIFLLFNACITSLY